MKHGSRVLQFVCVYGKGGGVKTFGYFFEDCYRFVFVFILGCNISLNELVCRLNHKPKLSFS